MNGARFARFGELCCAANAHFDAEFLSAE